MAVSWPCDWFVNLRRRQRRSQGVSCETLSERSSTSDQSESTAASSIAVSGAANGRKKGRILNAVSKMRDAYVSCMMNAATKGDCSSLVYGNGYCSDNFQFQSSYRSVDDEATCIRSLSQRSTRSARSTRSTQSTRSVRSQDF